MAKLQELLTEIATKSNQVNELHNAVDERGGDATQVDIDSVIKLEKEIEELHKRAAPLKALADSRVANDQRMRTMQTPVNNVPFPGGQNGDGARQSDAFKSIGEAILGDEQMSAWLKQWDGGRYPVQTSINSPRVEVKSFLGGNRGDALKTVITGAGSTSGGPLVFPDFKPLVDAFYQRPLTVRDIITTGETSSDTVEYVRVTSVTNAAAPVAEATSSTAGGTGVKPESTLAMARITETVKTIAHWIPVTNRALADAPQLRTMIDNFLRYGIEEELEDQILTGVGSGENFDGILHVANTTAQAFDTNILTTTRKGRTKVRTIGRATPTAWVFNPADWETIDLLQDNEARYYYGGPMKMGQPTLWGLPVVESEGMTAGTAVVADWRLAVLWDRMQTAISMSNSHSDFFIKNLVAILAEMRAAFGVLRPQAFVLCDLTA